MKGILHKSNDQWLVTHGPIVSNLEIWPVSYPLCDEDLSSIESLSLYFDNPESRISRFQDIEFDIIEKCPDHKDGCSCTTLKKYAKLWQK